MVSHCKKVAQQRDIHRLPGPNLGHSSAHLEGEIKGKRRWAWEYSFFVRVNIMK
jgi:hypothetical protein